ncbi:V-type ATP synthase subunit D [anaerobic digester metagenome]
MTAEPVRPTRMELIRKREQIRLAEQGRDLLREKMDALVREFFTVMNQVSASREELERSARIADRSLLIAQAVDDPVALKSASFVTKRRVLLDIDSRSIMGVPIPVIEKKSLGLSVLERGYSIIGTSGRVDEVAEKFEAEVDLIIELAETETTLRRIGHEILMTRRRVNALEQVMIPELYRETKYIKITIEEREREDLFRLKKVKRLLDRRKRQSRNVPVVGD